MGRTVDGRDPRVRLAIAVLAIALLACLAIAVFRFRVEAQSNSVELAMDYSDFVQLAQAYDYNASAFLIALRRAGLTSVALSEELGSDIGGNGKAYVATGGSILAQGRLSLLHDPELQRLAAQKKIDPNAIYLLVWDRPTYERYRTQLPLHFESKSVHVLRNRYPWLIELHTQIDFFDNEGLGIPTEQLLLAKRLTLLVIPRLQNDERFSFPQMDEAVNQVLRYDPKVSTIVFSGLSNEVFGYPEHLDDAAAVFKERGHLFNFGTIESYVPSQMQKGNETLARAIPGRTVRVQAIARAELEKLSMDDVVDRYVLGVRERNIRVVYLRTFQHRDGKLTIEQTNVEMVKRIADSLKRFGYRLGRATPIPLYHGDNRVLVGLAALSVPSLFTVLLLVLGWYRRWAVVSAYALTVLLYLAGLALHHDVLARSILALIAALLFAAAAFLVLIPGFEEPAEREFWLQVRRSLLWTLRTTGAALLGALAVVGMMSSPLAMEEIEPFRGVKLVLALPPIMALALYLFSGKSRSGSRRLRELLVAPLRSYEVIVGLILAGGALLLVMRSGNESDIAPSHAELVLRHALEAVLSVRPRFKEFLVGYPFMMLVPALRFDHRKYAGWFLALGAGVGIGDIIDTFSHLHTPLAVSVLRVFNGLWIGIVIGALFIWIYRRFANR